ncbi:MAG: methanogenesis marker 16 metalloprotein [Candidatus Helarchaeota archaeon]
MSQEKTIAEINQKIADGSAVVLTADELCSLIREEQKITIDDVDVVTTATKGLMSGTTAILSFQVSEAGVFKKAKELYLNDVPCYVGPCPNEYLGVVDAIVYGTAHSISQPDKYGGGHLFRDLIENKPIHVRVKTIEGNTFEMTTTLEEIPFAKMLGIRNSFKNYLAFVNPHPDPINSIFSAHPFQGNYTEATFCGCGELNPLQKDPDLETIGIGTPILMNGAKGYIIGEGTRSSKEKPNLMAIAEMHDMCPNYTGGFITSNGPEVVNSWAVAIPVLNEKIFRHVILPHDQIKLVIVDVKGRTPISETTYGTAWQNSNLRIFYDREKCRDCSEFETDQCPLEEHCPMGAFSTENGVDQTKCFNCGACLDLCKGQAFKGKLGKFKIGSREIPIKLRQSDLCGALTLARLLKRKILTGDFKLSLPIDQIKLK